MINIYIENEFNFFDRLGNIYCLINISHIRKGLSLSCIGWSSTVQDRYNDFGLGEGATTRNTTTRAAADFFRPPLQRNWNGNNAIRRSVGGRSGAAFVKCLENDALTRLRRVEDRPSIGAAAPESYAMVLHWNHAMNLESYAKVPRKRERWGNALLIRFTRHTKNMEVLRHRARNCGGSLEDKLQYAAATLDHERNRSVPP